MKPLQDGIPLYRLWASELSSFYAGAASSSTVSSKAIQDRKKNRDLTGDPWNGRTLEWSIPSPPPIYNFAITPTVDQIDPLWAINGQKLFGEKKYEDIHLPKNTPMGLYIGILSLIFGFAMTWHIWWLAIASFVAILACLIIRLSGKDEHEIITAAEVKEMEAAHTRRQEAVS